MQKFANEFKTFVKRGNVVDMAVGVIVGSSFTAIVNSVSNNVLMPLVNWVLSLVLKAESLSHIFTFLKKVYVADEAGNLTEEIDLIQSIYINWGLTVTTVLNFFLVALVLFTVVKLINKFREEHQELSKKIAENTLDKAERKELRAAGVSVRDKEAVKAYFAEKKRLAAEQAAAAAAEAERAKELERQANPTAEDLLKQILDEMRKS